MQVQLQYSTVQYSKVKYCTVQYSTVQFRHNSLLSESNGYNYSTVLEQCEFCMIQSLLLALEYYCTGAV